MNNGQRFEVDTHSLIKLKVAGSSPAQGAPSLKVWNIKIQKICTNITQFEN